MKYLVTSFVLLLTFANASAQSRIEPAQQNVCKKYGGKYVSILGSAYEGQDRRFKIRAAGAVSSATAREADYVEFKLIENVYWTDPVDGSTDLTKPLFAKDTSIFGVVTRRRSRHFPLVRGKLELQMEPLLNWTGERIDFGIARHGPLRKEETKKERKRRNDPCIGRTDEPKENCIAGRGDANVSILVTGVAGAGPAAVTAFAKDDDTRFIAATAFFSIAKDIGNLLNGTDVGISKDDIFDLVFDTKAVCLKK